MVRAKRRERYTSLAAMIDFPYTLPFLSFSGTPYSTSSYRISTSDAHPAPTTPEKGAACDTIWARVPARGAVLVALGIFHSPSKPS